MSHQLIANSLPRSPKQGQAQVTPLQMVLNAQLGALASAEEEEGHPVGFSPTKFSVDTGLLFMPLRDGHKTLTTTPLSRAASTTSPKRVLQKATPLPHPLKQ